MFIMHVMKECMDLLKALDHHMLMKFLHNFDLSFGTRNLLYQLHVFGGLNYALNERFNLMYYGSEIMTCKSWYDDTNSDQCHIRLRLIDISDYHDFRHSECCMYRKG